MKRKASGIMFVRKEDLGPGKAPVPICHAPAASGYVLKGKQILRAEPKVRVSKKERRRLRKAGGAA